jgi:hypothetical protein
MYEPFAAKSEWEYVRDILDPRIAGLYLILKKRITSWRLLQ